MIVAFTGHRPDKLGGYNDLHMRKQIKHWLTNLLSHYKTLDPELRAISGMALGVDQWAAEVCVDLGIPFTAAVPFTGQEGRWPQESQERYAYLMEKAASVHVVCTGGYAPEKMQCRNEWMVDQLSPDGDVLIAVWDGSAGGTANCVRYAEKIGKKIVNLPPEMKSGRVSQEQLIAWGAAIPKGRNV